MGAESLTDEKIDKLLSLPKRVKNPSARKKQVGRHEQVNYLVEAIDGSEEFEIFVRQSTKIPESFSCGLKWMTPSGEEVNLVRYNGPSHPHYNVLESDGFEYHCHIHKATQRYIATNRKPEAFAEKTDKYRTAKGALYWLLKDCYISGLNAEPENTNGDLFNG